MGSTKTTVIESALPTEEKSSEVKSVSKKAAHKPKVKGKNYKNAVTKVDKSKLYDLEAAIEAIKETSFTKFVSSVEFHATVKKQDTSVQVALPHSTGREKKVEFADDKTIEKLEAGNIDFDVLLATADMMPKLVKFARILGPKGMMPNPKNGTLVKSKEDAKNFSVDKLTIKTERKFPLIHTIVGKVDMDSKKIIENLEAVINAIGKRQIVKAHLTSTMGPSVKLKLD